MNMIFRAVKESDLEAIHQLALQSGIGITTLTKDKSLLKARLQNAIRAFNTPIHAPEHEYYLFVLEDLNTGYIAGTAAIESKTGVTAPFYSYRHIKESKTCDYPAIQSTHEYLQLTYENEGHSEICTLFLDPKYRKSNNGILLSLSRFLFISHFRERFATQIIAELRGVSNEAGQSPFWNAVGQHFFKMSFQEADNLTLISNKRFIADLIPEHPIYINLLSKEAQAVIGQPHPYSFAAMNILLREGFKHNQTVDIFDAGPTLTTSIEHIKTIKNAKTIPFSIAAYIKQSKLALISNAQLDFRAILAPIFLHSTEQLVDISMETKHALCLKDGDKVSISII